jgi:glycosyltransferase involved in cell wall biosynthesis
MSKPVCSIVIPTFNCRQFLPAALYSVAAQQITPMEVLVLDDGSSDGTWEYLQGARRLFPELVTVRGGNMGPAEGRNLLISMAKSDLIAFLDADDAWWPNKLKSQIAFHKSNPDVVLSFTDYMHIDPSGLTHGTAFDFWKPRFLPGKTGVYNRIDQPLAELLSCNLVGTSTVMATKAALQNANGFAKSMPSAEDWDLWLRLAERGPVAASRSVTMSYMQRPGSLTANRAARLDAMKVIIDRYKSHQGQGMSAARRQALARCHVARAEHHRAGQNWLRAAGAHLEACLKYPSRRLAFAMIADVCSLIKKPAQIGQSL